MERNTRNLFRKCGEAGSAPPPEESQACRRAGGEWDDLAQAWIRCPRSHSGHAAAACGCVWRGEVRVRRQGLRRVHNVGQVLCGAPCSVHSAAGRGRQDGRQPAGRMAGAGTRRVRNGQRAQDPERAKGRCEVRPLHVGLVPCARQKKSSNLAGSGTRSAHVFHYRTMCPHAR